MSTERNYVVSFHMQKYRFGDDLQKLKYYAERDGIIGTAVFYRILDGVWKRISEKGEKNEN